jgi:hypothetical protein
MSETPTVPQNNMFTDPVPWRSFPTGVMDYRCCRGDCARGGGDDGRGLPPEGEARQLCLGRCGGWVSFKTGANEVAENAVLHALRLSLWLLPAKLFASPQGTAVELIVIFPKQCQASPARRKSFHLLPLPEGCQSSPFSSLMNFRR